MNRRRSIFRLLPQGDRTDKTLAKVDGQRDEQPEIASRTTLNEAFLQDVQVRVPDLVVVTSDHADPRVNSSVQEVLRLMRDYKGVDVVFVADLNECGRHVPYGHAAEDPVEHVSTPTDSLEALWGERVVEERQQQDGEPPGQPPLGRHIHSRVVSGSGTVYGTLCCLCVGENASASRVDQQMLRHTAALTAAKIEQNLRDSLSLKAETS